MVGVWAALLGVCWTLTLGRCVYLHSTYEDHGANLYRVLQTLGCTLFSPLSGYLLSRIWALNLGLLCVITAAQVGTATALHGSQQAAQWRGRAARLSPLLICLSLVALSILGYLASSRGRTPFDYPSPIILGYWLPYTMFAWLGCYLLIDAFVAGLRVGSTRGEAITNIFGLATFGTLAIMPVLLLTNAALLALGDRTDLARWLSIAYPYYRLYATIAHSVLFAVPLAQRLAQVLQLDSWSRQRRQLIPLWNDLTMACPEIIHLAPPIPVTVTSRYRLHRTIIEIRDSMLILSRYSSQPPAHLTADLAESPKQADIVLLAIGLASAVAAKTRGDKPSNNLSAQRSLARDLPTDADELTRIARTWRYAKTLATTSPTNTR